MIRSSQELAAGASTGGALWASPLSRSVRGGPWLSVREKADELFQVLHGRGQQEFVSSASRRIYASPDGEWRFDEVQLPRTKRSVHPDAEPFDVSASYPASRVRVTRIPAGMREVAWHTVPEPDVRFYGVECRSEERARADEAG